MMQPLPSVTTPAQSSNSFRPAARELAICALLCALLLFLAGCQPSPRVNVLDYLAGRSLGAYDPPPAGASTGSIQGRTLDESGAPLAGATVVVAERRGTPHTAVSDAEGRYQIDGVPPGHYVPAAVAPGYDEVAAADVQGRPLIVAVEAGEMADAPPLTLKPRSPVPLPADLADQVALAQTGTYSATTSFPAGAAAQVLSYQYQREGEAIDTLRVYQPLDLAEDEKFPLLFFGYPGDVDNWEAVSVAFAAQGYVVVAISPSPAWDVDIEQHALDERIALHLARAGSLSPHIGDGPAMALGGSFTSAVLHRLLLDEGDQFNGWVTVGGIANAFSGAAAFYAGELELPPRYQFVIPALGQPNLFPLSFLRYSPVYTASQLPPTLIIHTGADRIIPIEQAYELEAALRASDVPVETFYYKDVSHYLQIGEDLTPAGKEMFYLIFDFIERWGR